MQNDLYENYLAISPREFKQLHCVASHQAWIERLSSPAFLPLALIKPSLSVSRNVTPHTWAIFQINHPLSIPVVPDHGCSPLPHGNILPPPPLRHYRPWSLIVSSVPQVPPHRMRAGISDGDWKLKSALLSERGIRRTSPFARQLQFHSDRPRLLHRVARPRSVKQQIAQMTSTAHSHSCRFASR